MATREDRRVAYATKLKDPRWQKRRLSILERDKWTCQACGDSKNTLHVHHIWYEAGREPWEAEDASLQTLCETCHEYESGRYEAERELANALRRFGALKSDVEMLAAAFSRSRIADKGFLAALTDLIESPSEQQSIGKWWAQWLAGGPTLKSLVDRDDEGTD